MVKHAGMASSKADLNAANEKKRVNQYILDWEFNCVLDYYRVYHCLEHPEIFNDLCKRVDETFPSIASSNTDGILTKSKFINLQIQNKTHIR